MSESLLNDETLTTADIAHPVRDEVVPSSNRTDPSIHLGPGTATNRTVANQPTFDPNPLFPDDELHNFRARWDQVQTSFVDEPRQAVEQADTLVANIVKRIAEQFSTERAQLEKQWDRAITFQQRIYDRP